MDLKEVNLLSKEIRNKYFELEKEILLLTLMRAKVLEE